ncbi:MAG: alpha/beta hydrolase [Anaerolineae bacterium]|nr:alpha/beta hydrolase [Anaerolineae bacterium]MDQ7034460.1 alpha/beta hydrolase [Anaerolineae bacterium]
MAAPKKHRILVNDSHLTVYEWGAPLADKPSVIFFHATGFHARCWDGVIRHLDCVHCYAVDARGHGTSDKPEPPHGWVQYGRDAAEVAKALGLKGAIGVGHSMGGNSLTRAAATESDVFSALVLIDPVIMPRAMYVLPDYSIEGHFVLKRRREWASADEMFTRFKGRGAFAQWQDDILRDYCEYGLLPNEDGEEGYVLACAPEVEAHIYSSSVLASNIDIYDAIAKIMIPVRLLRCAKFLSDRNDMLGSPTAPDLATTFENAADIPLQNNTHFIPMESPQLVAQHIRELLQENRQHQ